MHLMPADSMNKHIVRIITRNKQKNTNYLVCLIVHRLRNDIADLDLYLSNNDPLSSGRDDEQLQMSSLMNDINNIRQTQQSYGIPAIGDLFRAKPTDISETVNSIYYMLKQRVADLEFRQETRQKWNKVEQDKQEVLDQNTRLKQKNDQLQSEIKDVRNQLHTQDVKFKTEREKWLQEKEEMNKTILKLNSKETQYRHEIKSKDTQIEKLKDNFKQKLFEKATKPQITGSIEANIGVMPGEIKYSQIDFQLMISKNQEEIHKKLCEENSQLKECLKQLQRELFDIVDLKTEIYLKRYRAEFSQTTSEFDSEELIKHEIDRIRDELFNLPFEESSQEIIQKFQRNFTKLRDFMEKIDKEISQLSVFNLKDETYDDPTSKFSGIQSIQQLKHLLKSYDALVEGQHVLLNQSIQKMAKIPPPDEINATFNRFQILKDSELDEMRSFLNENKLIMQQQYKDFENEKKSFDEMTNKMESEKLKISEEREKIEQEVRKIRELNNQISSQLYIK